MGVKKLTQRQAAMFRAEPYNFIKADFYTVLEGNNEDVAFAEVHETFENKDDAYEEARRLSKFTKGKYIFVLSPKSTEPYVIEPQSKDAETFGAEVNFFDDDDIEYVVVGDKRFTVSENNYLSFSIGDSYGGRGALFTADGVRIQVNMKGMDFDSKKNILRATARGGKPVMIKFNNSSKFREMVSLFGAESFGAEGNASKTTSSHNAKFFVGFESKGELIGRGKYMKYNDAVAKAKQVADKEGHARVVSSSGLAMWTHDGKGLFQSGSATAEAKKFYRAEDGSVDMNAYAADYLEAEEGFFAAESFEANDIHDKCLVCYEKPATEGQYQRVVCADCNQTTQGIHGGYKKTECGSCGEDDIYAYELMRCDKCGDSMCSECPGDKQLCVGCDKGYGAESFHSEGTGSGFPWMTIALLGLGALGVSRIKNVEFKADCGCGCAGDCTDTKDAEGYPEVYDPVQDFLPRYRYPADSVWSDDYNPADPYRPLDYQTIHTDSKTRADRM